MFQNEGNPTVIRKRMSFFAVVVISITLVLITAMVSLTGITIYGMKIVSNKTSDLGGLLKETVQALPEIRKALPPALADALDDERLPDYRGRLQVTVRENKHPLDSRAVVEVENRGDRVVTLLSMRLIGLNADGEPFTERNTWAATPIQADRDWRGPLLPKETRRFTVPFWTDSPPSQIAYEVTDLRVWRVGSTAERAEAEASAAIEAPAAKQVDLPKAEPAKSQEKDEDEEEEDSGEGD